MPRAKGGFKTRRRHKKVLKMAEGYRNSGSRSFSKAYELVTRALKYAFRDRKAKKRDFRGLWIQRINAAVRNHDMSYSKFMHGLTSKSVGLDRKILADIAAHDAKAFEALVQVARS
ncbi:MAG: 50S ribosomal protein L20 [Bdellovibrionales bacterium]|nr:50S ribosomal protein L20 [Bdellovibrionales bacterium]